MLNEALDFKAESDALFALMKDDDAAFDAPTQLKGWTLNNVLEHLHMWNWAANESYVDEDNFVSWLDGVLKAGRAAAACVPMKQIEWWQKGSRIARHMAWFYTEMAARFEADAKKRLKWAGPDMSARSSISARLMETWAHGQEVFDQLGVRENTDSIRSIAVLGTNTFGWTYATRGETPPGPCLLLN